MHHLAVIEHIGAVGDLQRQRRVLLDEKSPTVLPRPCAAHLHHLGDDQHLGDD
jgi:hypothetical protein